jgi:RNA polymerase sigma-70 factor, ECF subfamily
MDMRTPETATHRDAQLMAEVRTGRPEALQELYHCYFRRGYALAQRILGDGPGAEDCVHEVFLKIWQRPALYNADRGAFIHWFLTVVHHQAINQVRLRAHVQPLVAQEDAADGAPASEPGDRPPGQSSVEDLLGASEIRHAVRAGLARLNPYQRTALELAYFGGLTQTEIATRLSWPLGTVKTRIRTGLLQLRSALEAADPGGYSARPVGGGAFASRKSTTGGITAAS